MRRLGLGGAAAALIVGLGVAVATTRGADNDGNAPVAKGLLSGLFHEKPKSHVKQENKASEEKPQPASPIESAAAQQQRHLNAWYRRVEVCDRLRMIAEQTGNDALREQADELEDRANVIYRQQTSALPLASPAAPSARDLPNPGGENAGKSATSSKSVPDDRGYLRSRPKAVRSEQPLGGCMDQREQAILNGKNMGGD
jgi:hypothetical protein